MKSMKRSTAVVITVCAAVALMVPAVASASKIEEKPGVLQPVGSELQAASTGIFDLNGSTWGTIGCNHMAMVTNVTRNDGTTFQTEGRGRFQVAECTKSGNPLTFEAAMINLNSSISGKGTAAITFIWKFPGSSVQCKFTSTATPFTYQLGSSSVVFNKAGGFTASPVGCGSLNISGTLEIDSVGSYPGVFSPVILN